MPDYASKGKGGRWYRFPEDIVPGGLEVPSVTTILANGLPAPALKAWGERTVAEYAVDNQSAWASLDRQAAIDVVKRAPYRNMTSAGNRGTEIHTVAEILLEHRPLPEGWATLYARQVDAIRAWLSDYNVKPISWERTVANATIGYAGTYDLYAEVDGTLTIVDWKSSKGVYGKMGLQLAAYACGEWELVGDKPGPMPPVHHGGIVHILPDGGYEYRPLQVEIPDLYDKFAHVAEVAHFVIDEEKDVLGRHLPPLTGVVRQDLKSRIVELSQTDGGLDALAAAWPVDIPTFKSGHDHTPAQLEALDHVLVRVENQHRPPVQVASREAHDELIGIVTKLTARQLEKLTARALDAGIPNLRTYHATDEQLALLAELVIAVKPNRKKPTTKQEATVT